MSRLIDRRAHPMGLAERFASRDAIAAATADNEPTVALADWLARLADLRGVPLRYLVPNARFMPDESIRFFQLDGNWVYALQEGAMSLGQAGTADATLHAVTRGKLTQAAMRAGAANDTAPAATGFFLRSQVVSGWPKLEIIAYDAAGHTLEDVRRWEVVSPSVLLYVVRGTIDHVVLREPSIGLHSGVDLDGSKPLRYVTVPSDAPPETRPGDQIDGVTAPVAYRDGGRRVLKIAALAADVATLLDSHHANTGGDGKPLPFTAAEFALEMVEGTQAVTFRSHTTTGKR